MLPGLGGRIDEHRLAQARVLDRLAEKGRRRRMKQASGIDHHAVELHLHPVNLFPRLRVGVIERFVQRRFVPIAGSMPEQAGAAPAVLGERQVHDGGVLGTVHVTYRPLGRTPQGVSELEAIRLDRNAQQPLELGQGFALDFRRAIAAPRGTAELRLARYQRRRIFIARMERRRANPHGIVVEIVHDLHANLGACAHHLAAAADWIVPTLSLCRTYRARTVTHSSIPCLSVLSTTSGATGGSYGADTPVNSCNSPARAFL